MSEWITTDGKPNPPGWKTPAIPAGWLTPAMSPGSMFITPAGGIIMGKYFPKYFDVRAMGPGLHTMQSPPDGDPRKMGMYYAVRNHADSRAGFNCQFDADPENGHAIFHRDFDHTNGRISEYLKILKNSIEWMLTKWSRAVVWFRPCQTKVCPYQFGLYTDAVNEGTEQNILEIFNGPIGDYKCLVLAVGKDGSIMTNGVIKPLPPPK